MSFKIKKCFFCNNALPIGYFRQNPASRDGHWAWCKACEKKYSYYDIKNNGNRNHVVSFSGGKDSTAMLFKMIEMDMRIDAVVYFDCGSFEWPQMAEHISKVEKDTGKKIITIHPEKDFLELASKLQPGNRQINGWPTPGLRWCTMIKINAIRQRLREFRPYVQYIGFSSDENDRVLKAQTNGNNIGREHMFINKFPLVEWGMTEADCLSYCKAKGYDWGGLYEHFSRVSCWCCPLQNNQELIKLCTYYPEMWNKLKTWNALMPSPFKGNNAIFEKIEKFITLNQFSA